MKIVQFIKEKDAINTILFHLGILEKHAHSPPKKETPPAELTYEPCYDDMPLGEMF